MVPTGQADFLVVLEPTQVAPNRHRLAPGGTLIAPDGIDASHLPSRKCLNVALLGALSARLDLPEPLWLDAIRAALPERVHEMNAREFLAGRAEAGARRPRP
jgi:indolepyruvate ferredoxin oxidoreductase beta subunit